MDTRQAIDALVLDFYYRLLERIFTEPLLEGVADQRRRRPVVRQIEEVAEAASKSLTLFLVNTGLDAAEAKAVLDGLARLPDVVNLEDVAGPNVSPEALAKDRLPQVPAPDGIVAAERDAQYRVALHVVMQVLTLMGPVMLEWRKAHLSASFEFPKTVATRLNRISSSLDMLGAYGEEAADENYELIYRDYLAQRFHRVEAGTVRMVANTWIGLDELFVMPSLRLRPKRDSDDSCDEEDAAALMNLAAAREFFRDSEKAKDEKAKPPAALAVVLESPRTVIVGAPGSGKSTFLEWLQLKVANVEEQFVLGGPQAIPLLLRLRELDVEHLPRGLALIEKATDSADRASLMPPQWIERQMRAGRVLFMIDGLDETDTERRDRYVLPWLAKLLEDYPCCHYVITSRPTGYPAWTLTKQGFTESDLLDFNPDQVAEYTRHWCTAVRLAQNEPEAQARKEGAREGKEIVAQFNDHDYIRNLARNPLMLSAICLVNYFEHGKLPDDRARLYELCVEGFVHNWDHRRGIHSAFSLDEKLRVCREVAIAMQANDLAEIRLDEVAALFKNVLDDDTRAKKLLEHIRHRSGLLIERRAGVFAFAHLTFQEYLAACAVHEGNREKVTPAQLVCEHDDGRWQEVIALYCGMGPVAARRALLDSLIAQEDSESLSDVLAEAYLACGTELARDKELRMAVLERILIAPMGDLGLTFFDRFPDDEVAPIANRQLGRTKCTGPLSGAYSWLFDHGKCLDGDQQVHKLEDFGALTAEQMTELMHLLHYAGDGATLKRVARLPGLYAARGHVPAYPNQAFIASTGLSFRSGACDPEVYAQVLEGLAGADMGLVDVDHMLGFGSSNGFLGILNWTGLCPDMDTARHWAGLFGALRKNVDAVNQRCHGFYSYLVHKLREIESELRTMTEQ